jgi:hypothetical protein
MGMLRLGPDQVNDDSMKCVRLHTPAGFPRHAMDGPDECALTTADQPILSFRSNTSPPNFDPGSSCYDTASAWG